MVKSVKILSVIIMTFFTTSLCICQDLTPKFNLNSGGKLFQMADEYLLTVPPAPDSLIKASDYIIAFSNDTLIQMALAGHLFNRFATSEIMGQESVAIHIAKNYFLNGKLRWQGEGGLAMLRFYVEFNENSLIGMDAPELQLFGPDKRPLSLRSLQSRYTLIYFFDDECTACKEGFPELKEIVGQYGYLNLSVYAVFTKSNPVKMNTFITEKFASPENGVEQGWRFVQDLTNESDYNRLYNVLKTPQIYLLDAKKKIIGRGLDNNALKTLLESEGKRISFIFEQAQNFAPQYLSIFTLSDTKELKTAFDPLFKRLTSENNEIYNAVFYHLFEFLVIQEDQKLKDAAVYLAQNYILPYSSLWYDKEFINKRLPQMSYRVINNRPGAKSQAVTLSAINGKAVNLTAKKAKMTLIYFFNIDCAVCKPFSSELKGMYNQLKKRGVRLVAVYMGDKPEKLPEYIKDEKIPWQILYPKPEDVIHLLENYEINQIPHTYILDKERRIIKKGAYPPEIKELLL
ncbi:MAG: redoxin domain-containing protein [Bacteroidales bacterium]